MFPGGPPGTAGRSRGVRLDFACSRGVPPGTVPGGSGGVPGGLDLNIDRIFALVDTFCIENQ